MRRFFTHKQWNRTVAICLTVWIAFPFWSHQARSDTRLDLILDVRDHRAPLDGEAHDTQVDIRRCINNQGEAETTERFSPQSLKYGAFVHFGNLFSIRVNTWSTIDSILFLDREENITPDIEAITPNRYSVLRGQFVPYLVLTNANDAIHPLVTYPLPDDLPRGQKQVYEFYSPTCQSLQDGTRLMTMYPDAYPTLFFRLVHLSNDRAFEILKKYLNIPEFTENIPQISQAGSAIFDYNLDFSNTDRFQLTENLENFTTLHEEIGTNEDLPLTISDFAHAVLNADPSRQIAARSPAGLKSNQAIDIEFEITNSNIDEEKSYDELYERIGRKKIRFIDGSIGSKEITPKISRSYYSLLNVPPIRKTSSPVPRASDADDTGDSQKLPGIYQKNGQYIIEHPSSIPLELVVSTLSLARDYFPTGNVSGIEKISANLLRNEVRDKLDDEITCTWILAHAGQSKEHTIDKSVNNYYSSDCDFFEIPDEFSGKNLGISIFGCSRYKSYCIKGRSVTAPIMMVTVGMDNRAAFELRRYGDNPDRVRQDVQAFVSKLHPPSVSSRFWADMGKALARDESLGTPRYHFTMGEPCSTPLIRTTGASKLLGPIYSDRCSFLTHGPLVRVTIPILDTAGAVSREVPVVWDRRPAAHLASRVHWNPLEGYDADDKVEAYPSPNTCFHGVDRIASANLAAGRLVFEAPIPPPYLRIVGDGFVKLQCRHANVGNGMFFPSNPE